MHVKELLSLKNKIVLITGGAGSYGSCMVEALAEADATVLTASRNIEASEEFAANMRKRGLNVHALKVDQADHNSVTKLKEKISTDFDGLDVLVNNAVARPVTGGWDNFTLEDLSESMRVNAIGMMDITREMSSLIAKRGGGTIINIASMMGMFGPDLSNYEGTDMSRNVPPDYFFHRAGMINFTRYLAHILADRKIRANCISPGGLGEPNHPERFVQNYSKKVMVGRMAVHDDIKGLIVFLASEASAYINGENILMDGGMHI